MTGWFPCAYVTLITEKGNLNRKIRANTHKLQTNSSDLDPSQMQLQKVYLMKIYSLRQFKFKNSEVVSVGAQPDYRDLVLKSYIESEKEYMQSLLKTLQSLLIPIGASKM